MRCSTTLGALGRTLAFGQTLWLCACVVDEPLGPPGKNMTGAVITTISDEAESGGESDTGAPGDMAGCDPLADPESECGSAMTCDLTSLTCVPALGTGLEDDPCTGQADCSPGLLCLDGRCRRLCDSAQDDGCGDQQICAHAAEPIPGLCLTTCELAFDSCSFPTDACKRVTGAEDVWAACVDNPGSGMTGDACSTDPECAPGYLCTPAAQHTLPCTNDASSCCTPVCDTFELPCLGAEPICYVLGIPGQDGAGYCGGE